jgi:hypothetical protein
MWMTVLALCLCSVSSARAQMQVRQIDDPPPVATYWEFGGNAFLTGNVDLVVKHNSLRAGGLAWLLSDDPNIPWNAVLMVSRLFGTGGRYLETGVGVVAMHRFGFDNDMTSVGPTATVGYRLQTRRRFARLGLTLAPPRPDGRRQRPMLGISFGRTFGG